jgi:hypothetical protein
MAMDLLDGLERDLAREKISVVEFAESDEYCGKDLFPRQRILLKLMFLEELEGWEEDVLDEWIAGGRRTGEIMISPNIREKTQYLRERGFEHFQEVDLIGGRRSSKGFITGIATAKVMWDTLQLQDPGRHFGVDAKKEIYFACVAASEDQAKQYQFADLINTVEGCQAFKPYWVRGLETEFRVATPADIRNVSAQQATRKSSKDQRDIARLRGRAFAANAGTIRGLAGMVIIFDEMAHMLETLEGKASASQVYSAATPSLDQFGKATMIFCNSSPYSKVGKFYERYVEAMTPFDPELPVGNFEQEDEEFDDNAGDKRTGPMNGNPYVMAFQFPSWAMTDKYREEFRKHPSKYREAYIPPKAFTLSPDWDPQEVDDEGFERYTEDDKLQISKMRAQEASNPDTFKVERRGKFAEVEDAYLKPEMVDRMFAGAPDGYDKDGKLILNPIFSNYGTGVRAFYDYVAHLDPSSTTAGFGFAMGHVEKFEHKDGVIRDHVIFDIIKRWEPKDFEGGAIDWEIVHREVMGYIELFLPVSISFDQYQSDAPIQALRREMQANNFNTTIELKRRTNESNWKQAEAFKTALYQGLVHAPHDEIDNQWSALELKFLIKKATGGKNPRVDRQEVGPVQTKDMADCIMEVTEKLIGNIVMRSMREELSKNFMAPGAMGGYSIPGTTQGTSMHPELAAYYQSISRKGEMSIEPAQRRPASMPRGAIGSRVRGISRGKRR